MSSALQHTPSSERAPLLRAASGVHTDASEDISATAEIPDMDNPTPLDKRVMFLLSFTRVCEPYVLPSSTLPRGVGLTRCVGSRSRSSSRL
jgi:hypothetical protein